MTKVEAIEKVMEDNGGTATLTQIYEAVSKVHFELSSNLTH